MALEKFNENKIAENAEMQLQVSEMSSEKLSVHLEASATQVEHSMSQMKENLVNKILESIPNTDLNLPEKSVLVNKLQGQIGDQYYVFTDEQKIRSQKSNPQVDDEDAEEEPDEVENQSFLVTKPQSTYRIELILALITVTIAFLFLSEYVEGLVEEYLSLKYYPRVLINIFSISQLCVVWFFSLVSVKVTDEDFLKNIGKLKDKYAKLDRFQNSNLWYDDSCDIPWTNYFFNLKKKTEGHNLHLNSKERKRRKIFH